MTTGLADLPELLLLRQSCDLISCNLDNVLAPLYLETVIGGVVKHACKDIDRILGSDYLDVELHQSAPVCMGTEFHQNWCFLLY